jgi:hypothetical protein
MSRLTQHSSLLQPKMPDYIISFLVVAKHKKASYVAM